MIRPFDQVATETILHFEQRHLQEAARLNEELEKNNNDPKIEEVLVFKADEYMIDYQLWYNRYIQGMIHTAALIKPTSPYTYLYLMKVIALCMTYQKYLDQLGMDHLTEVLLNHLSTDTSIALSDSIFMPSLEKKIQAMSMTI